MPSVFLTSAWRCAKFIRSIDRIQFMEKWGHGQRGKLLRLSSGFLLAHTNILLLGLRHLVPCGVLESQALRHLVSA